MTSPGPEEPCEDPVERARRVVADAKRAIDRTEAAIARLKPVPERKATPTAAPHSDSAGKVPARPPRRPDKTG